MTFERTYDREIVTLILTNEKCWRMMADDSAPLRDEFVMHDGCGRFSPILCRADDGALLGLFLLVDTGSPTTREVHLCFLPHAWGSVEQAGKEFVEWVWRETSINTLVGPVPSHNHLALRVAKACGFKEARTDHKAGFRQGEPFDLIITKVERPKHAA